MAAAGERWCRWRSALAGVGILATGISIGVATANYTHMRAMRGHTHAMVQGQNQHLEVSRQTLQALERRAAQEGPAAAAGALREEPLRRPVGSRW